MEQNMQRLPAEQLFQEEIDTLIANAGNRKVLAVRAFDSRH